MALLDAVKISEIPPSENIFKDDLLVVDRLQSDKSYVTNSVRLGKIADYITTLDLNFTGNVTFNNTIQPLPNNTLDAIFDNVTIRQSLTIGPGATVSGLYIEDLEDVILTNPKDDDILVYEVDVYSGEGTFVNKTVSDIYEIGLDELTDVELGTLNDGDILVYEVDANTGEGKFVNYQFGLDDLIDVELDTLNDGDILAYEVDAYSGEGKFVNVSHTYIPEAPSEKDKIYARQNGKWVDITGNLKPDPSNYLIFD